MTEIGSARTLGSMFATTTRRAFPAGAASPWRSSEQGLVGRRAAVATPFVGREAELAALSADLDAAAGGCGGVVLLAGEPGIGKTRLAEELAAQETARGALVLWGRCWEGEGAPAFWPWVQVVRAYVKAGDPAALRHDLGAGAVDIAQVVPAVRDCLPDLPVPPPMEPEAARFRMFDSLAGFLRAASAPRPLLLILDDLHWADAPSLALLRFVSRELEPASLLVVGIYRHAEVDEWQALVAERLGRLSDSCRRVLEVAAVVGRDFELRVLQPACGLDADRLLELLEEAEAARVVGVVAGGLGRWRFAHALVREVLCEGLPAARRVRLHGRVGEALEDVYAADPGPHLAELAHHFVAAAPGGQVARAVRAATLAGRRALDVLAWEDAAGLFERALAALELAERPDQPQRCELLLAVGEARMAASDVPGARAAYQQAGELARRIGSPDALARAGLGLGLEFTAGIVDQVEVGLLEEALAALGGADSPLRARVLARLARALLFTPQVDRRLAFSEEAVQMARRVGDSATLAAVLFDRHLAIWGVERVEVAGERLVVATEVVGLAERIGDRAMALRGRGLRRTDLLELGDLAGFDADLAAAEQTAQELRQLHYRWQLPLARAARALLAGRFAEAEEQAAQGLAIGRRAGDQAVEIYSTGVVATLRFMQGRFGEPVELLKDLASSSAHGDW